MFVPYEWKQQKRNVRKLSTAITAVPAEHVWYRGAQLL